MRRFTLKSDIVSNDKSTKTVDKITKAYDRMTRTISTGAKTASRGFRGFANNVGISAKKVLIGLNNIDASINRTFRRISQSKLALGLGIGLMGVAMTVASANIELDASLASLQAITGKTGAAFTPFRKEISLVSKEQRMFAGDTAKAFEIIGSAQPVLLKNSKALSQVTDAAIVLRKAGLMPVEESSKALTGTMNQFELEANQANRVINILAAGAKEGSANIPLLAESMDKVGAVAKNSNMSIEQTAAAVELLSKYNLKGSEAGVSLKTTLLRLKSAQLGFASGQFKLNDALLEYNRRVNAIKDPIKKAAYEEKVFGKIHILTGQILTSNTGELDRLTKAMTGTDQATVQANINSNTFKTRLAEIAAAFKNSVTATGDQGRQLQKLKDLMVKVADNMDRIIKAAITIVKIFLVYKTVLISLNALTKTYNVLLGIQTALSGKAAISMRNNTLATVAMNTVTKGIILATKAWIVVQKALNMLLISNPIGLVITAIGLLIIGIIAMVRHWGTVKKVISQVWERITRNPVLTFLLLPIVLTVKAIKTLVSHLAFIKEALTTTFTSIKNLATKVNSLFEAIGRFFSVVFKVAIIEAKQFFKNFWGRIKNTGIAIKEFAIKILVPFQGVLDFLERIGLKIKTVIIDKFKAIGRFVSTIIDKVSAFMGIAKTKIEAKTEQLIKVYGLDKKEEKTITTKVARSTESEKMAIALDKNTFALDKNTNASMGNWKGRFKTYIAKDANVSEKTMRLTQRELAFSAITESASIANTQERVLSGGAPEAPITRSNFSGKKANNLNGRIDINVVDKTGGHFGIQVESTGIEVTTTGNV